jgi:hypothetical protein
VASAKISWDGGDVAPVPRFPGETERKLNYGMCAQNSVSLKAWVFGQVAHASISVWCKPAQHHW